MKSVLIVGYGVVSHNLAKELEKLQPDIYDKYKTELKRRYTILKINDNLYVNKFNIVKSV